MATQTCRPFRWDDVASLARLIDQARLVDGDGRPMNEVLLREYLGQPWLEPLEHCLVIEDSDGLLAYTLVHWEKPIRRAVLELALHPDHRDDSLRQQVVEAAIDHASDLQARVLHICLPQQDGTWQGVLEHLGLRHARTYLLMQWDGNAAPQAELQPGFSFRPYGHGDGEVLAQIQNATFGASWGFCPNTPEQVEYCAAMSTTGPGGIIFLQHDNETAGYCWTNTEQPRQGSPIGTIGMIGIHPSYRGRSLSRPLLAAGMAHLLSRGVGYIKLDVDSHNDPALALYSSAGFKRAMDLHWYQADIAPAG